MCLYQVGVEFRLIMLASVFEAFLTLWIMLACVCVLLNFSFTFVTLWIVLALVWLIWVIKKGEWPNFKVTFKLMFANSCRQKLQLVDSLCSSCMICNKLKACWHPFLGFWSGFFSGGDWVSWFWNFHGWNIIHGGYYMLNDYFLLVEIYWLSKSLALGEVGSFSVWNMWMLFEFFFNFMTPPLSFYSFNVSYEKIYPYWLCRFLIWYHWNPTHFGHPDFLCGTIEIWMWGEMVS